jgi:hypothetical protein
LISVELLLGGKTTRIGTLTFILLFAVLSSVAQEGRAVELNVSQALALMKSPTWSDRSKGLEAATRLMSSGKQAPRDTDRIHLGLIQLLAHETSAAKGLNVIVADEDREDYSNYFGNLIGAVADLKDPQAIPALLGVADTGGIATRGIARFGKAALDPVLQQVKSQDTSFAEGALFVIRDMLEYQTVSDPGSLTRIKNALREALARPDEIVRESAIYAIEYLNGREEFVAALTDIAKNDPSKVDGQSAGDSQDNGEAYPVRRLARSLLSKIANHEPPVLDRGMRP